MFKSSSAGDDVVKGVIIYDSKIVVIIYDRVVSKMRGV